MHNKSYALKLVQDKINGLNNYSYSQIGTLSGYSKLQIINFAKLLKEKDIDSILVHGLTNKPSNNSPSNKEIEFIRNFKNQYPSISIQQFMDIFHEDIVFNPKMIKVVKLNNLQKRSYSFFENLYHKEGWKSTIKHKCFNKEYEHHPLREPSPRRGILIMIDGTPHDWFNNGRKSSLHIAIDDATGELLCGWLMSTECLEGHICEDLGINIIAANTPQAKGKVEKWNNTIQNRLVNDIKRFNIKSIDELNKFFNDFYCDYLNKKYAYEPKEKGSSFVPINNIDLSNILCIREERKMLDGNVISWKNNYYQVINEDNSIKQIFKGTSLMIYQNVLTKIVKVKYYNHFYNTVQIEGHRQDPIKREQLRIDNQKQLEQVLKERDKRVLTILKNK